MPSFNKVILMGNLTRSPELRYIPSGLAVTDVGLAVNDRRKLSSGEMVEEVTFVDVTLWGRTAEVVCQYTSKGSPLLVEGRLKLDSWDDKEGQKRSKMKVIGETIQLLGTRSTRSSGGEEEDSRHYNARQNEDSRQYSRQNNVRNSGHSAPPPQQDYHSDASSDGDDVPF
jgi:single-strand DNA-binding protein